MLTVEGLDVFDGDAQALDSTVSLPCSRQIVAIVVAPMGQARPHSFADCRHPAAGARGRIRFRDTDITGWPSYRNPP